MKTDMTIVLSEGGISLMTTDELVKQSFASLKVGAFEIRPGNPRQARCAAAVVRTVGFPRPVAYLMGLSSSPTSCRAGWQAPAGSRKRTLSRSC